MEIIETLVELGAVLFEFATGLVVASLGSVIPDGFGVEVDRVVGLQVAVGGPMVLGRGRAGEETRL